MDELHALGSSPQGAKPNFAAVAGSKVFISYASPDVAVADKLCNLLEAAGLACWVAPRDVRAGESYASAIVQAINACRMLVLVLSKSAIQSPHVIREVERASSKKRPILVVRLDAAELPPDLEYFLSANQWLDAANIPLERIVPSLVASVQGRAASETPREAARSRTSTRWISGAAALGVVVMGILAYVLADKFWLSKQVAAPRSIAQAPSATQPVAPSISEKSIAVLPFADMSEKKDQEYFSDGLSEELIDKLTKIPGLHVPARTSSFYFKGKSEDIPTIARRLMVAHVLEGSVRKSGTHMRVTAQLVRADNGYHLWSETYDRNFDDIFKVQDDIAGAVVKALKVSLLQTDASQTAPTANSAAYTLYLRAVALAKREAAADTVQAHAYLQEALRIDPQFSLAWAALAEIYTDDTVDWDSVFDAQSGRVAGPQGARRETGTYGDEGLAVDWQSISKRIVGGAHDAAERALNFGPTLPAAHLAMSRVRLFVDWDWPAAQAEIDKARALDPVNARILQHAASLAITVGDLKQAIDLAQRAVAQDPLGTAKSELAKASYRIGALQQAEATYRELIELYPTASAFHYRYALVLRALGNPQGAYDEIMRDIPPYRQAGLPLALDALGRRAEADQELAIAERKWGIGMAYQISYVYASRNQPERAMDWLERAYQQHDAGLISMLHDPMLKSLERNSRFEALLRKMHLYR
ncbi:MAG: hypothetical protein NVS1B6_09530 [Steroidobacteraceae bacterium]